MNILEIMKYNGMGDPNDHIENYRWTMDAYYLDENIGIYSSQLLYRVQRDYGTKFYKRKAYMISIRSRKNSYDISSNKEDTRHMHKL